MSKKRQINFLENEIKPYIFKQEKHIIKFKYNRHNESYEKLKETLEYDREPRKSFKDFIANELNPILPTKDCDYGKAPSLEPLNRTIQKAQETLQTFNLKKQELEQQIIAMQKQADTNKNNKEEVEPNDK